MNRRSFISSGLVLAGFSATGIIVRNIKPYRFEQSTTQLIQILLSALRDKQSAVHLGNAVLNNANAAIAVPDQVISIMHKLDLSFEKLNSIQRNDLMARLNDRTITDFDSGAIVDVDGWKLGQTEAQLCALAAQLNSALTLSVSHGENVNV